MNGHGATVERGVVGMGYYVHIHVCFSCDHNEPVAKLAAKHLPTVTEDKVDGYTEAFWFLSDLSKRTGDNHGPKGGLSLWGMTGNYTNGDIFVETLRPFWEEMLRNEIGPLDFEHILVFVEPEQTEQTTAYEIFLEEKTGSDERGPLVIKKHACPFSFMQM